jgi:hypothetical protein
LSPDVIEGARAQLRTRKPAPVRPQWNPPALVDFLPLKAIIAFDASLLNTGWASVMSYGNRLDVLGHGTIRPKTPATGYMATWERARLLEQGLWDAGLVVRFIRCDDVLMALEAPSVGGGHRTESSLVAGLTVWQHAPGKCAVVSATHVSAVLLGDPKVKSEQRKPAIKEAVARYVPESAGRDWTEHERDALSVGLTRLFDLREAA